MGGVCGPPLQPRKVFGAGNVCSIADACTSNGKACRDVPNGLVRGGVGDPEIGKYVRQIGGGEGILEAKGNYNFPVSNHNYSNALCCLFEHTLVFR